jgi:hypothetical protein
MRDGLCCREAIYPLAGLYDHATRLVGGFLGPDLHQLAAWMATP